MKKKFITLLLAICMIIPCVFMLNACGEKDNSNDYLSFTLLEDGTYSVALKDNYRVWYDENNMPQGGKDKVKLVDKIIKIPNTYDGKAVTKIGYNGFSSGYMARVEIPSSVTFIDRNAFMGAVMLESVVLPEGLKVICSQAFYDIIKLKNVVVPSSIEYIGDYAFDSEIVLYYNGNAEQFSTIKGVSYYDNSIIYSEYAPIFSSEQKLFFYTDDISDITSFFNPEKSIKGIWKYNDNQEIESVAIEYGNTVNGKTYEYTNSDVNITDEGWQIFVSTHEQGMLEMLLTPEEVEMFTSSSNKEEYAEKCETHNATLLSGMRVVFADGQLTLWQNDVQYSQPYEYVEVNGAIYYKLRGVYSIIYTIDGNKIVEDSSTEYGGAKHYYTEQA